MIFGDVKLVSVSQPKGFDTAEQLIVYCARVSNPKNQTNFKTGDKLLTYLINEKHWSPFEMVNIVLEIETTRDIGRQILRHRSLTFQEFSGRYSEYEIKDVLIREARLQDPKNRQNSIETGDLELQEGWDTWQKKVAQVAGNAYKWALENGIAKEQARAVLPEGLTPTRMYANGTLRSWITYVESRTHNSTQKEHRIIANKVKDVLMNEFHFLKNIW